MAGFELTLYGRIWVTPKANFSNREFSELSQHYLRGIGTCRRRPTDKEQHEGSRYENEEPEYVF
jgi:hypothetical protein